MTNDRHINLPPLENALGKLLHHPSFLTFDRQNGQVKGKALKIYSSSLDSSGNISVEHSAMGSSVSPHVSWSPGPTPTRSYVLIFEDGVANRNAEGTLHWLVFNIPSNVTHLPEGISLKDDGLQLPIGSTKEGANINNKASYTGMTGGVTGNIYWLQLFALDCTLDLPNGCTRDEVWEGMKGHVIANGALLAHYRNLPEPQIDDWTSVEGLRFTTALSAYVHKSMYQPTLPTIYRPQGQVAETILNITSSSFSKLGNTGTMPTEFTSRGASISPEVSWSPGPKNTKSYVLFFEDALTNDDGEGRLHWLVFNIPPHITQLPEGVSNKKLGFNRSIELIKEGTVYDGCISYSGPSGIAGAPPFHFHIQVFALDITTDQLPLGATRKQVWQLMNGHVIAKGQTIAFFQPLMEPFASMPPPLRHF